MTRAVVWAVVCVVSWAVIWAVICAVVWAVTWAVVWAVVWAVIWAVIWAVAPVATRVVPRAQTPHGRLAQLDGGLVGRDAIALDDSRVVPQQLRILRLAVDLRRGLWRLQLQTHDLGPPSQMRAHLHLGPHRLRELEILAAGDGLVEHVELGPLQPHASQAVGARDAVHAQREIAAVLAPSTVLEMARSAAVHAPLRVRARDTIHAFLAVGAVLAVPTRGAESTPSAPLAADAVKVGAVDLPACVVRVLRLVGGDQGAKAPHELVEIHALTPCHGCPWPPKAQLG